MSKGDFEKALEAYKMALSLDSDYSVTMSNQGTAYLYISFKTKNPKDFQKSLHSFKKAIEINPNYAPAYNGLGGAYMQAGNLEGAIYCFEKALEIKPDFGRALYNLGLAYLEKGNKTGALDVFNKYKETHYSFISLSERKTFCVLFSETRRATHRKERNCDVFTP